MEEMRSGTRAVVGVIASSVPCGGVCPVAPCPTVGLCTLVLTHAGQLCTRLNYSLCGALHDSVAGTLSTATDGRSESYVPAWYVAVHRVPLHVHAVYSALHTVPSASSPSSVVSCTSCTHVSPREVSNQQLSFEYFQLTLQNNMQQPVC